MQHDTFDNPFSAPEVDEMNAQLASDSVLQPGDEGWWRVWACSVGDIREGDIVLTKNGESYEALFIEDIYPANSPTRFGIVVGGGQRQTLGRLVGVVIMRKGTKNTLSSSAF